MNQSVSQMPYAPSGSGRRRRRRGEDVSWEKTPLSLQLFYAPLYENHPHWRVMLV
jgi:hypothetical protein